MNENHQIQTESHGIEQYEDEIDLVDLVGVLWRRRWIMLGIIVVIVGLAIAYCLIATPKYEIISQISPGITGFDEKGNPVRDLSANDIQTWFEKKSYLETLVSLLGDEEPLPELKAGTTRQASLVTVSFYWPDADQGKQLLNSVVDDLSDRVSISIQQIIANRRAIEQQIFAHKMEIERIPIERERLKDKVQNVQQQLFVGKRLIEQDILKIEKDLEHIPIEHTRINNQIASAKNKLKVFNTQTASIKKNIVQAKKASALIQDRINSVNSNTEELIKLRQKLNPRDSDKLALLMYSNIIQQNISYATNLQRRSEEIEKEINRHLVEEAIKSNEISDLKIEIKDHKIKQEKELPMKEVKLKKNILTLKAKLTKTIKDAEIQIQEYEVKRDQELNMKTDNLQEKIDTLKSKLASLTPVEMIQPPFSSREPVKPAKRKIVAIAIALSCFMAVLAAFLIEFWVKNRERVTASSPSKKELLE